MAIALDSDKKAVRQKAIEHISQLPILTEILSNKVLTALEDEDDNEVILNLLGLKWFDEDQETPELTRILFVIHLHNRDKKVLKRIA